MAVAIKDGLLVPPVEIMARLGYHPLFVLDKSHVMDLPSNATTNVEALDEFLQACLKGNFEMANFLRDQLRVQGDLQPFMPWVRPMVVKTGIRHLSFSEDRIREAHIGQAHHEFRRDDEGRSPGFKLIYHALQPKWGPNTVDRLTYYGAVDTTADLFTALAEEATEHPEFLNELVFNDDLGREITIAEGAQATIDWVENMIVNGPFLQEPTERQRGKLPPREPFVESMRSNEEGIRFQHIADGGMSTMHAEGGLAGVLGNYHDSIAYLEVQIGAIRALTHAADLYPEKAEHYLDLATKVREATRRRFYMPDKQYFAVELDRDELTRNYRQVKSISVLGASVLDSDLFDDLKTEDERQGYIEPVVKRLVSLVTDMGLWTKAKEQDSLVHDPDDPDANVFGYQETKTSWPRFTADIIRGLHLQGFHNFAEQLENRLVNFVNATCNAEFGLVGTGLARTLDDEVVDITGVVAYNYKTLKEFEALTDEERRAVVGDKKVILFKGPYWQNDQLWTASAVARILLERENGLNQHTIPGSWQDKIEQQIFTLPDWRSLPVFTDEQIQEVADNGYFFVIDDEAGPAVEQKVINLSERKREEYTNARRLAAS